LPDPLKEVLIPQILQVRFWGVPI